MENVQIDQQPQQVSVPRKRIEDSNPAILCIYGKGQASIVLIPIGEKVGGTALGSFCRKSTDNQPNPRRWIAKVGWPQGVLRNDVLTIRSRTTAEMNFDTITEKIASDLYQELGRGFIEVPKTRLTSLPILERYTQSHSLAQYFYNSGIRDTLRIASRFIDHYQDFEKVQTRDENGQPISFMAYIERYHRPPDGVLSPQGHLVPLKGFCSLLAIGRVLADVDMVGGQGGNAGVRWIRDASGTPIEAQTVKIDPGYAFQFTAERSEAQNCVINTRELHAHNQLNDLRDLQLATTAMEVTIHWNALTREQKDTFLLTLMHCASYLDTESLHFLFYRDGRFNRSLTEGIPVNLAHQLAKEMQDWLRLQCAIYQDELREFDSRHCPPVFFIKPQPITKRRIGQFNPELINLHNTKHGLSVELISIAEKASGSALGSICKKTSDLHPIAKRWMAKVGMPHGELRNDALSIRSRGLSGMNLDTIREKIAADLYHELGKGLFEAPKTRLTTMPILDAFTQSHPLAQWIVNDYKITHSLRVAARFVKNYDDFENVQTLDADGQPISFMAYIQKYHRPPDQVLTPLGGTVALSGFCSLLSVGRALADVDLIGGGGNNAGVCWVYGPEGTIISAKTVKIDPGFAFQFNPEKGAGVLNWVLSARQGLETPLTNQRDLQISTMNDPTTIYWDALTKEQQEIFLSTLLNTARYLETNILQFLFYRDGLFNRSPTERISPELAHEMATEMESWFTLQLALYREDLEKFEFSHPEHSLRIHYIDKWGELELPMVEEKFLVRELFTELAMITSSEQRAVLEPGAIAEAWDEAAQSPRSLPLDQFFASEQNPIRRLLLLGPAGIGKSTLFQKIAHDWASDRLFQGEFQAVYWIPLRLLNSEIAPGGSLHGLLPDEFIARILATRVLNKPNLEAAFLRQLQTKREKILILLDGYDEAQAPLRRLLEPLLSSTLHIILTSRPGVTEQVEPYVDRTIENRGFADPHIETYANRFFCRKEMTPVTQARAQAFLNMLKQRSDLFQIAHVPLQLQMLCTLWEQGAEQAGFANSSTRLYLTIIDQLFRWQCRKAGLDHQSIPVLTKKKQYTLLGTIAEKGLSSGTLLIPQAELLPILEAFQWTEEQLLETGLLKASGNRSHYHFLHLTFQEYLIGYHFSRESQEKQTAFILAQRHDPSYRLPLAFLAGSIDLMDLSRTKEKTQSFFNTLCQGVENPNPAFIELLLRCLNECPDYKGALPVWLTDINNASKLSIDKLPLATWAAREGLFHALQTLTNREGGRALLQVKSPEGATPLMYAAWRGHLALLIWLHRQDPALLSQITNNKRTICHAAASGGHINILEYIIQEDPTLLQKIDISGGTPLHSAAQGGRLAALQFLLSKDPTLLDKLTTRGETVMHIAAKHGHVPILEFLHERDPQLFRQATKGGKIPLHLAAQQGQLSALRYLYEKDHDTLQAVDEFGWTVAHFAAATGQLSTLQWICEQDRTLLQRATANGRTLMHRAAEAGHIPTLEWLAEQHPPLLTQTDAKEQSPIAYAQRGGQQAALNWLQEHRPNNNNNNLG